MHFNSTNPNIKRVHLFIFQLFCYLFSVNGPLHGENYEMPTNGSLALKNHKEFVLYTMPKTGTHLLQPLLELLTKKKHVWIGNLICPSYTYDLTAFTSQTYMPNTTLTHWFSAPISISLFAQQLAMAQNRRQFISGHTPYTASMNALLTSRQCKVIFVMRDPRDYVISLLNHIKKARSEMFNDEWFYELDTFSQIAYIITGTDWYNSTVRVIEDFIGWKNSPICCTLEFEKLLGRRGGRYSEADQVKELRKLAHALQLTFSDKELVQAFNSVYGKGSTFHKGVTGSWKDYFNDELKDLFKFHANHLLIELGYENGSDW